MVKHSALFDLKAEHPMWLKERLEFGFDLVVGGNGSKEKDG